MRVTREHNHGKTEELDRGARGLDLESCNRGTYLDMPRDFTTPLHKRSSGLGAVLLCCVAWSLISVCLQYGKPIGAANSRDFSCGSVCLRAAVGAAQR